MQAFQNLKIRPYEQKKCPLCGSPITKRNGTRDGKQLYKCMACGRQFRSGVTMTDVELWALYQCGKQTVAEIAASVGKSPSTVKRRLRGIAVKWEQPCLEGMSGFVHLDVTYWGRNWGVLLALDDATGRPLYIAFVRHETVADYMLAIETITRNGYAIKGIVIDGFRSLFGMLGGKYKVQMCQFHMRTIVDRYLTKSPRLKAAVALKGLMGRLTTLTRAGFEKEFDAWKEEWRDTLNRRTLSKRTGRSHYTHRRLRTAMNSVAYYLPYLFTYLEEGCEGMPNTNNKVEGVFADLKKNLNNHSGMGEAGRKRFINGFFLALADNPASHKGKAAP